MAPDPDFLQRITHLIAHLTSFEGPVSCELTLLFDEEGRAFVQLCFQDDDFWSIPLEEARMIARTFMQSQDGGMQNGLRALGQHMADAVAHYDAHFPGAMTGRFN